MLKKLELKEEEKWALDTLANNLQAAKAAYDGAVHTFAMVVAKRENLEGRLKADLAPDRSGFFVEVPETEP